MLPAKCDLRCAAWTGRIHLFKYILENNYIPDTVLGTRDSGPGQAKVTRCLPTWGLLSMKEVGINQVHSHKNRGLQLVTMTKTAMKETEIVLCWCCQESSTPRCFLASSANWDQGGREGAGNIKNYKGRKARVWTGSKPKTTECLER